MSTPENKRKSLKHSFAQIGPSKTELAVALVLHMAAMVAVLVAAIPFILTLLLVVVLFVLMARHCHQWRCAPIKRWIFQNDRWYLSSHKQKEAITGCYYWSRLCVVLTAEGATLWNKQYRLIFWDACSADDFRHIKLVSRYGLRAQ